VLTAYQLAQAVVMPIAGKLSDELGRKRVFMGAVVLFTTGSLLAAIAPSVYLLIPARVMQALGGGAFLPTASGIVSEEFKENRARAIGLFSSVFPMGGVVGPTVGGLIVDHFSWRGTFLLNVPLGVLLFFLATRVLRESERAAARRTIDALGIGMLSGGMVLIMYAMTDVGLYRDLARPAVWGCFLSGVLLLSIFLRHEARHPAPVLDVTLLRQRPFVFSNLLNFFYGASIFGVFSFIPLYAVGRYGFSASEAGALLTPRAVGMAALSAWTAFMLRRTGYRLPMAVGLGLFGVAMFLLSRGFAGVRVAGYEAPDAVTFGAMVLLMGVGVGIAGPAANNAAIELMPDKVAAITGLRGMFRSVGGLMGTAVTVMIVEGYTDQTRGLQDIFLGISIIVPLVVIPLVFGVPNGARAVQTPSTVTPATSPSGASSPRRERA
jgi:EmrB/QacA subfamily drug resistance transporter